MYINIQTKVKRVNGVNQLHWVGRGSAPDYLINWWNSIFSCHITCFSCSLVMESIKRTIIPEQMATKISINTKSALTLAQNLVFHERRKHIDRRFRFHLVSFPWGLHCQERSTTSVRKTEMIHLHKSLWSHSGMTSFRNFHMMMLGVMGRQV